jgi:hypothetical protein
MGMGIGMGIGMGMGMGMGMKKGVVDKWTDVGLLPTIRACYRKC